MSKPERKYCLDANEKMKVPWINDFQLIQELGIKFECRIEIKLH